MTRQEFEEALLPLTKQELFHQKNPSYFKEHYLQYYKPEHINFLTRPEFIKDHVFQSESNILDSESEPALHYRSSNIRLNRQDRFSDVPIHHHGYIEMNFVFSGTCTAIVNKKKIPMSTGDICIMDRQAEHTIFPTGMNDIVLNIMLSTDYFSNTFIGSLLNGGAVARFLAGVIDQANEHNQYLLFHTKHDPLVKEIIENIFIEYLNPGICCEDVLRYNLNLLFIELARCYQGDMERKHQQRNKRYITEILNYMEQNVKSCSLEAVAKTFNYHPNYLSRLMKAETGLTFQENLSENRLNRAVFLLKNSDMPIYKIVSECGYQNQNFFYQKFIKKYGQTPKEYRNLESAQNTLP
ncbi:MAG: AraC family transcriptional regulator [Herbinix sp.]|jgi:AraC-like DNA-binding protein/mannose-6-phosphate isomerase-like protein (cupin superfamily)|nr:AraC family transcriptional regulator [Herbinix sp.]